LREWADEIEKLIADLKAQGVEAASRKNRDSDLAKALDTLGFVHLRLGEGGKRGARLNLEKAKAQFLEAFELNACDTCARHLTETVSALERLSA